MHFHARAPRLEAGYTGLRRRRARRVRRIHPHEAATGGAG